LTFAGIKDLFVFIIVKNLIMPEGISKIKHLSLRGKKNDRTTNNSNVLTGGLIEDTDLTSENFVDDSSKDSDIINQSQHRLDSLDLDTNSFFEQTINFKSKSIKNTDNDKDNVNDKAGEILSARKKNEFTGDFDNQTVNNSYYSSIGSVKEIKRVFQKTILLLVLDLIAFTGLVFTGINLFFLNSNILLSVGISILVFVVYVALTNILYIIIPEKKFLWSALFSKVLIFVLISSFIGQIFSITTVAGILVVFFLAYVAYNELEKIQLGSRLFTLSSIINESTRVLITMSIVVISLCVFNQIIYRGTDDDGKFIDASNFTEKVILSNNFVMDSVLIGKTGILKGKGLNNYFISKNLFLTGESLNYAGKESFTLRDFFVLTYKNGDLLTEDEVNSINEKCGKSKNEKNELCVVETRKKEDEKLAVFRDQTFPRVSKELTNSSVIDLPLYRDLTKQIYLNNIKNNSGELKEGGLSNIPLINLFSQKYIIPALYSLIVFFVLTILRPILSWGVNLFTYILWYMLRITRFAKIEIETVESEVVSI
jgi:hypothetical protein